MKIMTTYLNFIKPRVTNNLSFEFISLEIREDSRRKIPKQQGDKPKTQVTSTDSFAIS